MKDEFPILVHLYNPKDGARRVYKGVGWPSEYNEKFEPFIWEEGNYACDCNRSLFLYDWDEEKEMKCGDTIVIEKIVDKRTKEILYKEV